MARTPNKPNSKPHVPYRGDDFSVGKKTGIRVARVDRTADGYEKFDDLLSQANARTPPRRKKKSIPRVSGEEDDDEQDDEDDEDGELSMDVDSPVHYSTTPPRAIASSRPVSRGDAADFDAVPSPRARKSIGRAGPSRLAATTLTARELLEQDEGDDMGGMDDYPDDREDDVPVRSPKGKGKGKATHPPQDDSFGDADDEVPVKSPRGKGVKSPKGKAATPAPTPKGKGRALPPVDEEDEEREIEDDIARGMQDIDHDPSDEEEEEEPAPPKKKAKANPKPKQTVQSRTQKENSAPEGVRRSRREPQRPLAFWRGEKYVYAPREPGQKRLIPYIQDIIRIDEEPPMPRRAGSKRKRARARSSTAPETEIIEREVVVEIDASNPEAGWDDDTSPTAVVLDYHTAANVTRRVAFTAKMFDPKPAKVSGPDDAWLFEKIFGDGDFMAAGQLVIPPGKRKPAKGTKDNTYIFYVVEGAVNVFIDETQVVLATGGMFMVPRGNSYFIENIAERPAKLFFTQARKMREDEVEEEGAESAPPRGVSVAMGGGGRAGSSMGEGRSGSAGIPQGNSDKPPVAIIMLDALDATRDSTARIHTIEVNVVVKLDSAQTTISFVRTFETTTNDPDSSILTHRTQVMDQLEVAFRRFLAVAGSHNVLKTCGQRVVFKSRFNGFIMIWGCQTPEEEDEGMDVD
ncbi:Mif2/CENP-C like-domain-containing protein [Mycena metata]|uniref:CENP-C homolog n=1 Tax=Mycena metata TaxID=1033252 RepID=A0AAD7KKN8_9AGAR|nr:Mif2/CENP-C like-domain-containing protein [Mycena metata]